MIVMKVFISAALQGLGTLSPRISRIISSSHRVGECDAHCTACLVHLPLTEVNTESINSIEPHEIFSALHKFNMVAGRQQDCHEFLSAILAGLDDILGAEFFNAVGVNVISRMKCLSCGVSKPPALEKSMILSLNAARTIPQALKEFSKPEIVSGENAVICTGNCQRRTNHEKKLEFEDSNLPESLILHFKRFTNNMKKVHRNVKLTKLIRFCKKKYFLAGIVEHVGNSINSGHYVSYKVDIDGNWWRISDQSKTSVSFDMVQKVEAYIAFYNLKLPKHRKEEVAANERKRAQLDQRAKDKRAKRANETGEQRQQRLEKKRERRKSRISCETPMQRAKIES